MSALPLQPVDARGRPITSRDVLGYHASTGEYRRCRMVNWMPIKNAACFTLWVEFLDGPQKGSVGIMSNLGVTVDVFEPTATSEHPPDPAPETWRDRAIREPML